MKKCAILVVLATLFLVGPAFASPFLVCDPYVGPAVIPDYFKVTIDSGVPFNSITYQIPASSPTAYILHYDLGAISVGQHSVSVSACKAATTWSAEVCSAVVPFTFTRPAAQSAPAVPTNIGLATQ